MITQNRVMELFEYADGNLIRKIRAGNTGKRGSIAGTTTSNGYLQTVIDGKSYKNHRLVWLWHYGYLPEQQVDHINRDRSDNRIENLREVSAQCNCRNRAQRTMTSSGIKGVVWYKRFNKWMAQIVVKGKQVNLGTTPCLLEAACLRLAAEQAEGWGGCESTSPAFVFVRRHIGGGDNGTIYKQEDT